MYAFCFSSRLLASLTDQFNKLKKLYNHMESLQADIAGGKATLGSFTI